MTIATHQPTRLLCLTCLAALMIGASTARADFTQTHEIVSDEISGFDFFSWGVGISGDIAVVSAYGNDDGAGSGSGSVYLFNAVTGAQITKLSATDPEPEKWFGHSVGISGNNVIVGARRDDPDGPDNVPTNSLEGAAYLFSADGTPGPKITASDAGFEDQFGIEVSIEGNLALIGSVSDDNGVDSGSAYVFDVTTATEQRKLLPDDGAAGDLFGTAIAMSGNIALIGAPGDADAGSLTGSAYLFDVTTGNQIDKLTADDGQAEDRFGTAVALDGDHALIGAWGDDDLGDLSGAAYLFDLTNNTQMKLTANDTTLQSVFGRSVAIQGNIAVVGAMGDNSLTGAVYLFDVSTGDQIAKLTADDGVSGTWGVPRTGDLLGWEVALDGGTIIAGTQFDQENGISAGSAYIFEILEGDLDLDGFVGINDLNIVLGNWNQNVPPGDPLADPSGDGFVGIDDLNTVLGYLIAGTSLSECG